MTPTAVVSLFVTLVASWLGTRSVLRLLRVQPLRGAPREPGSRSLPAPRGGGLAFVAVILAGILVGLAASWVRGAIALALVPSVGAIGLLGWKDDRHGLSVWFRLLVQVAAAAWVVYCLDPAASLDVGFNSLPLGPAAVLVSVVGLVGLANLFSSMDGMDGIAGGEGASVAIVAALLCLRSGDTETAWLFLLVAAAVVGFLPWNWAPARVYMGGAGSMALGFLLAALALLANQRSVIPIMGSALVLGVFVVDATLTLIRRIVRRELLTTSHQSHAYQRTVLAGESAARVTGAIIAINLVLGALVWTGLAWPRWTPALYGAGLLLLLGLYVRVELRRPMGRTVRRG
jgi:Fuc2NAc and GlcNAc transferase